MQITSIWNHSFMHYPRVIRLDGLALAAAVLPAAAEVPSAIGSQPVTGWSSVAEPPRSLVFETVRPNGDTIVLSLQEANFAAQDFDGLLTFNGTFTGHDGSEFDLIVQTSVAHLASDAQNCVTTLDAGTVVLGISSDMAWLGLSVLTDEPAATVVWTDTVSTGEASSLTVSGNYLDLAAEFAQFPSTVEFDIVLAQSLAVMTSNSGSACAGTEVDFDTCIANAALVCGAGCVKSVTFVAVYDINGVVRYECSITCKDDC